jgi:phosphoribosylformylglycinamidine cyclo-ligase
MSKKKNYNFSYLNSGVNVNLGNELVKAIKPISKKINDKNVLNGIGGFGAVYDLKNKNYKKPLLISTTDGVGTKILIAKEMNKYDTIGIDLVAMSVNDLIVQGAKPLFFLDYIAVEKIKKQQVLDIIKGIAKGCSKASCSLVGGETAELPGLYHNAHFDLAGFAVGIVDKSKLLPKNNIKNNDVLIGLPSNGIHSNGFSLIRNIFKEKKISYKKKFYSNISFGDILLKPTLIYVKTIQKFLNKFDIKGISHITGGGIAENLLRVLPKNVGAEIFVDQLDFHKKNSIFKLINQNCKIGKKEMLKTFNCGIGMILIVKRKDLEKFSMFSKKINQPIKILGKITNKKNIIFI